ncbi:MAG: ATP-dependent DNA helicase RecG [Verrucomicrobia bacterium]|nr:ATP-dependent DNA helicase RecG [Verrucomicrobiota bacterium]
MNEVEQSLSEFAWLPEAKLKLLGRLGILTLRDLVEHYPRRYEDRTQFAPFPTAESETPICIKGVIIKVNARYFGSRKIVEVVLEDLIGSVLSQRIYCRWFNQHYIQRMLAAGHQVILYGRPKIQKNRIYMDHPEFEVIEDEGEENIHMGRITPVYPLTDGLRQRALRGLIFQAVQQLQKIEIDGALESRTHALIQIHFPESWEAQNRAREILALEELVALQIIVQQRKRAISGLKGEIHAGAGRLGRRLMENLPFRLTGAQKSAIEEIRRDLKRPVPMNRLLHGDVGAGKTLVAAIAMLDVVEQGFETALMAPTQVLAEQHYRTLWGWFSELGIRMALRTSTKQDQSHLALEGNAQVIVGTHALLFDPELFGKLGLVIIDEQHKFGVLQRTKLLQRQPVPDLLVMTATPIPRTLAMTVYGDLDVSVLDEKPKDRKPIITRARSAAKVPEAASFISERIKAGRQAYIIYPVIEESQSLGVKAATSEFEHWRKLLPDARCGLLHGRLSNDEKERVMEQFRCSKIDVLVSTTVIEVGVDVPNATVMVIENAERFGLAQLHQLRGRIGRSEHQSYCVLLTDNEEAALERLSILEHTENGFEIAEADLRLRGPGNLLGTEQSGLPPLKLADLIRDAHLVATAKELAQEIVEKDPHLVQSVNQRFRNVANAANGTFLGN